MGAVGPETGAQLLTGVPVAVDPRQEPIVAASGLSATPGGSFTPGASLAIDDFVIYAVIFNQQNLGNLVVTPPSGYGVIAASTTGTDRNAVCVATRRVASGDTLSGLITLPNWRLSDGITDQARNYVTIVAVARGVRSTVPVAGFALFGAIVPQAAGNSGTTAIVSPLPVGAYLLSFFSARPAQASAIVNLDAANSLPTTGWVERVEQAVGAAGGGASIVGAAFSQTLSISAASQAKLAVTFSTSAGYQAAVFELAPVQVGLTGGSRGPSLGFLPSTTAMAWTVGTLPAVTAAGSSGASAGALSKTGGGKLFPSVQVTSQATVSATGLRLRLPGALPSTGAGTASAARLSAVLAHAQAGGSAVAAAAALRRRLGGGLAAGHAGAQALPHRLLLPARSIAGAATVSSGAFTQPPKTFPSVSATGAATARAQIFTVRLRSASAAGAATARATLFSFRLFSTASGHSTAQAVSLRLRLPATSAPGRATTTAPALGLLLGPTRSAGSAGVVGRLGMRMTAVSSAGSSNATANRLISLLGFLSIPGRATAAAHTLSLLLARVMLFGSSTGAAKPLIKVAPPGSMTTGLSTRMATTASDGPSNRLVVAQAAGPGTSTTQDG